MALFNFYEYEYIYGKNKKKKKSFLNCFRGLAERLRVTAFVNLRYLHFNTNSCSMISYEICLV